MKPNLTVCADAVADGVEICQLDQLIPGAGVCALHAGESIALFYLPDTEKRVFALHNFDPIGNASVISRGIVGDIGGRLVVASPLYKQHFDLQTGECLEDETVRLKTWVVQVVGERVLLQPGTPAKPGN